MINVESLFSYLHYRITNTAKAVVLVNTNVPNARENGWVDTRGKTFHSNVNVAESMLLPTHNLLWEHGRRRMTEISLTRTKNIEVIFVECVNSLDRSVHIMIEHNSTLFYFGLYNKI